MLKHNEDTSGSFPRHPVVCILDTFGFVISIGFLLFGRLPLLPALLVLIMAFQYSVSFLHHWLPYNNLRSKLDRSVIFVLIGATYLAYWGSFLPAHDALERLPWVGVAVLVGLLLLYSNMSEKVVGIFWVAFSSAGMIISSSEFPHWFPSIGLAAFWVATSLYGLQQLVFSVRFPNLLPELFGYREAQHVLLLGATTISSVIMVLYT